MGDLAELVSVCHGTDTDKITERKKNVDKLKSLLGKSYIVQALDANSDAKKKDTKRQDVQRLFGWDSLFKVAKNLVYKEAEALRKAKGAQTQTTITAREKKKQDVSNFVKLIVRQANKRGPRLKGADVVKHVLYILEDEYMCKSFGTDHSSMLLKDILCVRAYWCELNEKMWHELIIRYCGLLADPPPKFDRVVLARIIHLTIEGSSQQCDLRGKKIFPLLEKYFHEIKQEKVLAAQDHMVRALHVLSKALASNSRVQVCKLGENVFLPLLYIWNHRPSESLKNEIVEFLRLQMCIHHPRGAKEIEEGAFAVDWDSWKSNLRKLYEVIHKDLKETGGRSKYSTGSRDSIPHTMPESYIALTADLCHQLFTENSTMIDVTQASFIQTQVGNAAKRRKVESGWGTLRETISGCGSTLQVIPWLQLVTTLVKRYPRDIPEFEFLQFLNTLHQLLSDSKKHEVTKYMLVCLKALAFCQSQQKDQITEMTQESCELVWNKVWAATLRIISLHHVGSEGFELLTTLIDFKLVNPDKDIWTLFLPNLCSCSESAVTFLLTFLKKCDLPEGYRPSVLTAVGDSGRGYPLRHQLFDWMVPGRDEDMELMLKGDKPCVDPKVLGEALVVLTLRDTHEANISMFQHQIHNDPKEDFLFSVENVHLQTSFDAPFVQCQASFVNDIPVKTTTHLPVLQQRLMHILTRDGQLLTDKTDFNMKLMESLAYTCCLIAKVLQGFVKHKVMNTNEIVDVELYKVLEDLMAKLGVCFSDVAKRDSTSNRNLIIRYLTQMFSWDQTSSHDSVKMAHIFRSITPDSLLKPLLTIACDKGQAVRQQSHDILKPTSRHHNSRFDDMDIDTDFDMSSSTNDLGFDDDFETTTMESQDSDGFFSGTTNALQGLFVQSALAENQLFKLDVIRLLCKWCSHEGPSNKAVGKVKEKLLELLDEEDKGWDCTKAYDLQLLKGLIAGLTSKDHTIHDEDMVSLLEPLRTVCKEHRRNQDVCSGTLDLLSLLIPHLVGKNDNMVSESMQESRQIVLYLVGVFWKLSQKQNEFTHAVRNSLGKCIRTFLLCDPDCNWSFWKMKSEGGVDSKCQFLSEVFPQLLKDSDHSIRLGATHDIKVLFVRGNHEKVDPFETHKQNETFDLIYELIQDVMVIEGRLSTEEQKDEAVNRTSTVLHTLATIARVSRVCEKKAVFGFCQMVKKSSIDEELVKKILSKVSDALNFPSLDAYMIHHLPFLIHTWLESGYKMEHFPHKLLDCATLEQFYRLHYKLTVSYLVMHKNLETVKTIGNTIHKDTEDLIEECIPKIIVHIIPLFAASRKGEIAEDREVKKRLAHATGCYEKLLQVVSEEMVNRSVMEHLDEIVVDILMTLYDEPDKNSEVTDFIKDTDPEPNPPHFNTYMITSTLEYLTRSYGDKVKSLVSLLAKTPDAIQKILLSLRTHMVKSQRCHEKRRILLMYRLFIKLVLKEFHEQLGGGWAFVLRDVIFTLVYNMEKNENTNNEEWTDIVNISCSLLTNVCEKAVECCPEELSRFLPTIVGTLVPLVKLSGDLRKQSHRLLNLLMVENASSLQDAIRYLDLLPLGGAFDTARKIQHKLKYKNGSFTLEQELEHFLKTQQVYAMNNAKMDSHVEGLKFLQKQLSTQKQELYVLIQQSSSNDTTVIRVLFELLQLSKSKTKTIAQEAARCLGELGPIDLSVASMTLPTRNPTLAEALTVYKDDSRMMQYCHIFHLLDSYLIDSSVDLVRAASDVLKKLLATKSGIEFYTKYKEKTSHHLFQYLHPFKSSRKKVSTQRTKKTLDDFTDTVDTPLLWCPNHSDHSHWIKTLCCKLIESGGVEDEILQLLGPICDVKPEFCEKVLPFLIHIILLNGQDTHKEILSRQVGTFFSRHCQSSGAKGSRSTTPTASHTGDQFNICSNLQSVRAMLDVVQYLRLQDRPCIGSQLISIASQSSSMGSHPKSGLGDASQQSSQDSQLEELSHIPNTCNINVQELMLEAYRCIGDPDGVYGCGAGRLSNTAARIQTYVHENQWEKALGSYDLEMERSLTSCTQLGLLQALQNFGTTHILDTYLKGTIQKSFQNNEALQEFQFEAAWKMGKWDLDLPTRLDDSIQFNQALYSCFTAIKDKDMNVVPKILEGARVHVLQELGQTGSESLRNTYPFLSKLQCLSEMEAINSMISERRYTEILTKWNDTSLLPLTEYAFAEPILHQRCVLANMLLDITSTQKEVMCSGLMKNLEILCKCARNANRHQVAERAIYRLKRLDQEFSKKSWSWRIEESELFWAREEQETAKHLMKTLIHELDQEDDPVATKLYPKCLGMFGTWLADTRSESPEVVIENYLSKAVDLLETMGIKDETALNAYLSLAKYADNHYSSIASYMKSSTFEAKQNLIQKAARDVEGLEDLGDTGRYLRTLKKQQKIDEAEVSAMLEDKNKYLLEAVHNYLMCLQTGDSHDMRVFRLTSLWFDNAGVREVNEEVRKAIKKIKSYKFLPVMYQLAARMSNTQGPDSEFQQVLNQLIESTVKDHPHHTLSIVLALAHANKDTEMIQAKSKRGGGRLSKNSNSQDSPELEEARVTAAKEMVARLKTSKINSILNSMEKLCEAYIQLANWDVSKYKSETKAIKFPDGILLKKITNLSQVAVPTADIKVDPGCEYTNITYIQGFASEFKLAGGINLPKIISCIGSDGIKRRQLVKGKDDLRQDAVMQQVFGLVNSMLNKNPETRKRKLNVRMYKVIPLSRKSGLLEWCEGTIPIGEYLIGGNGAHLRYRPMDLKAIECRRHLSAAHEGGQHKKKVQVFLHVCKKFQPVMRHFFMENFPDPAQWYEKRLAYTRSVATNSIVGYILGLGDRHVQNILIDCTTAELVHIDLGIAFEQGKILPTPETVPFRLTRDMVDGMGVAGVEGVFRRCCEKTMEVMHHSQEALLTILQVLLYDPLYVWTISPQKAYNLQQRRLMKGDGDTTDMNATGEIVDVTNRTLREDSQENVNQVAERVLLRLQQKLGGQEDGVTLSVHGQVNHLIQEARDPNNLCRLFPGWQPYI